MAHYGWLGWYIKKLQRLTAFTYLAPTLRPRLWPDEVQVGLVVSRASSHYIVTSAVEVGALLDVWPIMGG